MAWCRETPSATPSATKTWIPPTSTKGKEKVIQRRRRPLPWTPFEPWLDRRQLRRRQQPRQLRPHPPLMKLMSCLPRADFRYAKTMTRREMLYAKSLYRFRRRERKMKTNNDGETNDRGRRCRLRRCYRDYDHHGLGDHFVHRGRRVHDRLHLMSLRDS